MKKIIWFLQDFLNKKQPFKSYNNKESKRLEQYEKQKCGLQF